LVIIFTAILPIRIVSAEPPKRIISLAPNITEILYSIGLGQNIVGVTSFCDHPEEAKRKNKVGGMSNPSLETVLALKPDIVIMTTDGNLKEFEERLRSLRIKTYVFQARRLSDISEGIRKLGAVLDVNSKADILAQEIDHSIKQYRQTSKKDKSVIQKKVLFVIWPEPLIVAGSGTLIDDSINLLGHRNIAAKAKTAYPKYSIEEIIRQSPDAILIGKGHSNIREMSKGLLKKLSLIPAVKNGNVFYLSDNLYRTGPKIVEGIKEMAQCLR
jgi:iron complex transport system substrate-binding protein